MTTVTLVTAVTTLKDLRQSERAVEKAKTLVAKREGALNDARVALQEQEQIHRAKVEAMSRVKAWLAERITDIEVVA